MQRCVRSAYLWLSWLAPPSCPAVYLICKGELWSSSTVSAKVLYSSHNPKWQQQHQDELQERGGSLSVIYNALNSSTLLIVCITKNQTRGKTNKKCHFLFRFNAIESTSLSLRSRLFTSGSVWSRNRDYGGGWKPLQTAFINTIKEWRHEKRDEGREKESNGKGRDKQKGTGLGETGKGRGGGMHNLSLLKTDTAGSPTTPSRSYGRPLSGSQGYGQPTARGEGHY